jgi:hypothetical protein
VDAGRIPAEALVRLCTSYTPARAKQAIADCELKAGKPLTSWHPFKGVRKKAVDAKGACELLFWLEGGDTDTLRCNCETVAARLAPGTSADDLLSDVAEPPEEDDEEFDPYQLARETRVHRAVARLHYAASALLLCRELEQTRKELGEPPSQAQARVTRQAIKESEALLMNDGLMDACELLTEVFRHTPAEATRLAGVFGWHLRRAAVAAGHEPVHESVYYGEDLKSVSLYDPSNELQYRQVIQPAFESLTKGAAYQRNVDPKIADKQRTVRRYLDTLDIGGHVQRAAREAAARER